MKYYQRKILIRKAINKYGKMGYVEAYEFIKTNDIEPFNKGLRVRFVEGGRDCRYYLLHKEIDKVYQEEEYITPKEAFFRRSVSNYGKKG